LEVCGVEGEWLGGDASRIPSPANVSSGVWRRVFVGKYHHVALMYSQITWAESKVLYGDLMGLNFAGHRGWSRCHLALDHLDGTGGLGRGGGGRKRLCSYVR